MKNNYIYKLILQPLCKSFISKIILKANNSFINNLDYFKLMLNLHHVKIDDFKKQYSYLTNYISETNNKLIKLKLKIEIILNQLEKIEYLSSFKKNIFELDKLLNNLKLIMKEEKIWKI